MNNLKKNFFIYASVFCLAFTSYGVNIQITNIVSLELDGISAHSLFDSNGDLLSSSNGLNNNIRLGAFNSGFDALASWNTGDLLSLNSNFNSFGSTFGMNDLGGGLDGLVQSGVEATVNSTNQEGFPIVLWATNGGSFTSSDTEHLIFVFNTNFPVEPASPTDILLSDSTGSLIAGGFGNFSQTYGEQPTLDGFNTVSVVPEPSTYAAIAGFLALGWVMLHRRQA
jgi:hypothetical protein